MLSPSMTISRFICIAGLLSLLHCAYSAAQHRFYLRLTEQPFTLLPTDLILQTLISLIAVVYGASYFAGDFLPVRSDLQNRSKSWDTVGNCPSFYTFDHRARALIPEYSAFDKEFVQGTRQATSKTTKWMYGAAEYLED
ncbi:unnamed protein product [Enterobius vermicularis]|uniref:Membrane magnesium transporter n=1 Tax=Enterobius vermicularis TaxID=51028 RepID=A0A0N4VKS1_ENTVE|nr:unnamed protein product [Enterobius vermicularis]